MLRDKLRKLTRFGLMLSAVAVFLGAGMKAAAASEAAPAQPVDGIIVPDQFLRSWDPITFFFAEDLGPGSGAPETNPSRYVTATPSHPGAYTWLNARTLQFRPAEPWPPLTRFTFSFRGQQHELVTLLAAPTASLPRDGASDLDAVETLTLTFPEPVNPDALAKMLAVELRRLPGVASDKSRWLSSQDFDIKVMERTKRSDSARYVIAFHEPIPEGTHATAHLRLSLDDQSEESFRKIQFSTAAPFTVARTGCGSQTYPITPDGVAYSKEQAIRCTASRRAVDVVFSARPQVIDPVQARNLVRFTPAVDDLNFVTAGNTLAISGHFEPDTLYRVNIEPSALKDDKGRDLKMMDSSELYLFFPRQADFLRWDASHGIVERYGPKMLPLEGRGFSRLDLRIHKVDPLNRSLWPFPDQPVVVDEGRRPPGPGEEPEAHTSAARYISSNELGRQLAALGSPSVSTLVDLPLQKIGGTARFGLDLAPHLAKISGKNAPGTYLVGMRKLDGGDERAWVRVQVTDLSLTTTEEAKRARLWVTSLRTGAAVEGAEIRVQGARNGDWVTFFQGTTDSEGKLDWNIPGRSSGSVRRILVRKGEDVLVLDPTRPPENFRDGHWYQSNATWLQWVLSTYEGRQPSPVQLCHIFTERPVYKPEEPVHIKGYIRRSDEGELYEVGGTGTLVINGPGGKEWIANLTLSGAGSFYYEFLEENLPTGEYRAHFKNSKGSCGSVVFQKESYRLPKFEVNLSGPLTTGLDEPFKILMNAKYYAGGKVAGSAVRWRVTQFPYNWTPDKREGFAYSTDARYSGADAFRSTPALHQEGTTDDQGIAELSIDPTIEPTAQPRRYVVEATVIGADDQSVTNTHEIRALPPFVLAMKLPRYLEKAEKIEPEILVVGADGKLVQGQPFKLRLLRRQWHSHLQASDFTQGDAKYVTEVVDETIAETTLTSTGEPMKPSLPIDSAGVYLVEIEAQDKLGRSQVLRLDLFAGGTEAVTWSQPPTQVFKVTTDKNKYSPGETATLVLESPFQTARVLAMVEEPDGRNRYQWLDVRNGAATFTVNVRKQHLPRVPVHFLMMRGRVGKSEGLDLRALDLGKPATLATTTWLTVTPKEHTVDVALDYPEKAQPGDEVSVDIRLRDARGNPLSGEVTLWLVDQAVLALGKEQRLDPVPDFIRDRGTLVEIRDTRNLVIGHLPLKEVPGGDGAEAAVQMDQLLDNVTVRKNFKTVPFYAPAISVGAEGKASVKIKLPDNLTNFKIRAKVVSGADRFGFASGMIAVRLPVIVQPSLPRFVRPGDRFVATAIGRIVEGEGGAGRANVRVDGLQLGGDMEQKFVWQPNKPQRIDYQLTVPTPAYTKDGKPEREEVSVTLGVEREKDKARDAFSVSLPIKPDRRPVIERRLEELRPGQSVELPEIGAFRTGTLRRSVLVSNQPALIRMAAGLSYLMAYPHGCTEQRISRARVQLASKKLDALLQQQSDPGERERVVRQTLEWIEQAVNDNGLAGYWPGSTGYVSLTAWSVEFMAEARNAGFNVNGALLDRMTRALKQSLRSDYQHFITGASYAERTWALAALAAAGQVDEAYAAELARKTDYLNLESTAQVTRVLASSDSAEKQTLKKLSAELWGGIVLRLHQGKEIYGGLQKTAIAAPAQILPSETRTLSEVLRAVAATEPEADKRKQLLLDALVTLGRKDGWGTTNANASAMLALVEFLANVEGEVRKVSLQTGTGEETLSVGGDKPLVRVIRTNGAAIRLTRPAGDKDEPPLAVRSEIRYLPQADGSQVGSVARGFVINRELQQVATEEGVAPQRLALDKAGLHVEFSVGDVVEEHVELVNPEDRHYVAVVIPLAAGMEPLNPALATAPPEAKPQGQLTLEPSYVAYMDDQMAYYYDTLPKGTFHFYFRTRATIPGDYVQPAAYAEMMYQEEVNGNSNGARIAIKAVTEDKEQN